MPVSIWKNRKKKTSVFYNFILQHKLWLSTRERNILLYLFNAFILHTEFYPLEFILEDNHSFVAYFTINNSEIHKIYIPL